MEEELLYAYCIMDVQKATGHDDLPDGLEVFTYSGLSVVMKRVGSDEYAEDRLKENLADIEWVERATREHLSVISRLAEKHTVVPFKFGTIFHTKNNILKFIDNHDTSIKGNLANLKGREEWSFKLYSFADQLESKITGTSEELKALDAEIGRSSPGKAFMLKKKRKELLARETDSLLRSFGQKCYEQMLNDSFRVKINPVLPRELTERHDDMVLNLACLIDKERVDAMLKKLEALQQEGKKAGFSPEASGPWPPFGFVSIKE